MTKDEPNSSGIWVAPSALARINVLRAVRSQDTGTRWTNGDVIKMLLDEHDKDTLP